MRNISHGREDVMLSCGGVASAFLVEWRFGSPQEEDSAALETEYPLWNPERTPDVIGASHKFIFF